MNFDNKLMNVTCQMMKKWMKECERMMEKMKMPMNQMEDVCELEKYFTCECTK